MYLPVKKRYSPPLLAAIILAIFAACYLLMGFLFSLAPVWTHGLSGWVAMISPFVIGAILLDR